MMTHNHPTSSWLRTGLITVAVAGAFALASLGGERTAAAQAVDVEIGAPYPAYGWAPGYYGYAPAYRYYGYGYPYYYHHPYYGYGRGYGYGYRGWNHGGYGGWNHGGYGGGHHGGYGGGWGGHGGGHGHHR